MGYNLTDLNSVLRQKHSLLKAYRDEENALHALCLCMAQNVIKGCTKGLQGADDQAHGQYTVTYTNRKDINQQLSFFQKDSSLDGTTLKEKALALIKFTVEKINDEEGKKKGAHNFASNCYTAISDSESGGDYIELGGFAYDDNSEERGLCVKADGYTIVILPILPAYRRRQLYEDQIDIEKCDNISTNGCTEIRIQKDELHMTIVYTKVPPLNCGIQSYYTQNSGGVGDSSSNLESSSAKTVILPRGIKSTRQMSQREVLQVVLGIQKRILPGNDTRDYNLEACDVQIIRPTMDSMYAVVRCIWKEEEDIQRMVTYYTLLTPEQQRIQNGGRVFQRGKPSYTHPFGGSTGNSGDNHWQGHGQNQGGNYWQGRGQNQGGNHWQVHGQNQGGNYWQGRGQNQGRDTPQHSWKKNQTRLERQNAMNHRPAGYQPPETKPTYPKNTVWNNPDNRTQSPAHPKDAPPKKPQSPAYPNERQSPAHPKDAPSNKPQSPAHPKSAPPKKPPTPPKHGGSNSEAPARTLYKITDRPEGSFDLNALDEWQKDLVKAYQMYQSYHQDFARKEPLWLIRQMNQNGAQNGPYTMCEEERIYSRFRNKHGTGDPSLYWKPTITGTWEWLEEKYKIRELRGVREDYLALYRQSDAQIAHFILLSYITDLFKRMDYPRPPHVCVTLYTDASSPEGRTKFQAFLSESKKMTLQWSIFETKRRKYDVWSDWSTASGKLMHGKAHGLPNGNKGPGEDISNQLTDDCDIANARKLFANILDHMDYDTTTQKYTHVSKHEGKEYRDKRHIHNMDNKMPVLLNHKIEFSSWTWDYFWEMYKGLQEFYKERRFFQNMELSQKNLFPEETRVPMWVHTWFNACKDEGISGSFRLWAKANNLPLPAGAVPQGKGSNQARLPPIRKQPDNRPTNPFNMPEYVDVNQAAEDFAAHSGSTPKKGTIQSGSPSKSSRRMERDSDEQKDKELEAKDVRTEETKHSAAAPEEAKDVRTEETKHSAAAQEEAKDVGKEETKPSAAAQEEAKDVGKEETKPSAAAPEEAKDVGKEETKPLAAAQEEEVQTDDESIDEYENPSQPMPQLVQGAYILSQFDDKYKDLVRVYKYFQRFHPIVAVQEPKWLKREISSSDNGPYKMLEEEWEFLDKKLVEGKKKNTWEWFYKKHGIDDLLRQSRMGRNPPGKPYSPETYGRNPASELETKRYLSARIVEHMKEVRGYIRPPEVCEEMMQKDFKWEAFLLKDKPCHPAWSKFYKTMQDNDIWQWRLEEFQKLRDLAPSEELEAELQDQVRFISERNNWDDTLAKTFSQIDGTENKYANKSGKTIFEYRHIKNIKEHFQEDLYKQKSGETTWKDFWKELRRNALEIPKERILFHNVQIFQNMLGLPYADFITATHKKWLEDVIAHKDGEFKRIPQPVSKGVSDDAKPVSEGVPNNTKIQSAALADSSNSEEENEPKDSNQAVDIESVSKQLLLASRCASMLGLCK